MTATFTSLGLTGLTDGQKLDVVGQLWDDLFAAAPPGSLLSDAQREELLRRQVDAKNRPDDWVAWDEVLAASVKRLAK